MEKEWKSKIHDGWEMDGGFFSDFASDEGRDSRCALGRSVARSLISARDGEIWHVVLFCELSASG